jgi:hypothetical protein
MLVNISDYRFLFSQRGQLTTTRDLVGLGVDATALENRQLDSFAHELTVNCCILTGRGPWLLYEGCRKGCRILS